MGGHQCFKDASETVMMFSAGFFKNSETKAKTGFLLQSLQEIETLLFLCVKQAV